MKKLFILLLFLLSLQGYAQDTLTEKCWTPEMDTTDFQNFPTDESSIGAIGIGMLTTDTPVPNLYSGARQI